MNSIGQDIASLDPRASATMEAEQRIALEIMGVVSQLELPLKLDKLTKGDGNCFPLAIIQQCKRPEIMSYIRPAIKRFVNKGDGHSFLRKEVRNFIMKSKTERVKLFRFQYEQTDGPANSETWEQYWGRMVTDKIWVDYWFVQATAWYLQLDMWIITTSSTNNSPYIEINGNLEEGGLSFNRPILILGTKSNSHYQSLLPIELIFPSIVQEAETSNLQIEKTRKKFNKMTAKTYTDIEQSEEGLDKSGISTKHISPPPDLTDDEATEDEAPDDETKQKAETSKALCSQYQPFKYSYKDTIITFARTSADYQMRCPNCSKDSKQIVQHLAKNKVCQHIVDLDSFKIQFKVYKKDKLKEDQNKRKRASRSAQKAQCKEKFIQNDKKWGTAYRTKQRLYNEDEFKQKKRDRKAESMSRQREMENTIVKDHQNKRQKLSRGKRKEDELKELQNKY